MTNLVEVSLTITKASLQPDGSMRWLAVVSDTSPDSTGESTSIPLFQDWIRRATTGQRVDWLPPPRMPFLGISHYPDLDGAGEAGVTEKMYIDGDKFKASGIFYDNPIGRALFAVVKAEADLVRRGEAVPKPVRISAAWWDIGHSHGAFSFLRKSLTDTCPMCAKGGSIDKVYLMGQPDHFASTRVPIHPRTSLALTERAMTTRKEDAATIVGEELAEELESKSQLVGKSETESPAIVVKASRDASGRHASEKPKVEEEEMDEETEEEEDEEKPKGKGKGKPPWLKGKAFTWEDAKGLPEAKSLSRVGLMGLVRRNIAEQPEEERLGLFEALLDDMSNELNEIKTAVEDLYFAQPAVEDELLLDEVETPERDVEMDYLDTFTQAVTEALESDQPAAQKAELIQRSLNAVALAIKADLEAPTTGGDMVAAFKAALAPLSDQLAQLNARLNMQGQPTVVMPTQKSFTVPAVQQQPVQNQLPVSPITGQPSSITAAVRATTIPGY